MPAYQILLIAVLALSMIGFYLRAYLRREPLPRSRRSGQ